MFCLKLYAAVFFFAGVLQSAVSVCTSGCSSEREGQILLQQDSRRLKRNKTRHAAPIPQNVSKWGYTPSQPYHELPGEGQQPGSLLLGCQGKTFLHCWDFFTYTDPTYGYVDYVSLSEAKSLGIYSVTAEGSVYLGSVVGQSQPAKSIRLQARTTFEAGVLFVIDIKHMPTGYGTWPAWWSTGANWPNMGEIDTIEAVETDTFVYSTLHTAPGCSQGAVSGISNGGDCHAGNGCDGCGVSGPANSAGSTFNANGGGVYVTSWTDTEIQIWFFPRGSVPNDIISNEPQPSTWSEPYVTFPLGNSCENDFFHNQQMVINLDFCGSWAGAVFPSLGGWPGGQEACEGYVRDPNNVENLKEAYWLIDYVKVFKN